MSTTTTEALIGVYSTPAGTKNKDLTQLHHNSVTRTKGTVVKEVYENVNTRLGKNKKIANSHVETVKRSSQRV